LKVLFFTVGPPIVASSRVRVFQYLPYLNQNGIKYKTIYYTPKLSYMFNNFISYNRFKYSDSLYAKILCLLLPCVRKIISGFNLLFSMFQVIHLTCVAFLGDYDIIFIQKVVLHSKLIKLCKSRNKRIVFEFDDAIYLYKDLLLNKSRFDELIPMYDLIITENHSNKNYVRSKGAKNVLVITGPIDTKRYECVKKSQKTNIIIGWIGSPATQKYLEKLMKVFQSISEKYDHVYFETIGSGFLDSRNIRLIQKKWDINSEVKDLQDFDIGIMPLPNDEWSEGKGGYKLLQYMSIGIPCCASPVGINKTLIKNGVNGYLCETDEQWVECLSKLIDDEQLRRKMGANGRKIVEERYSLQVVYPKFKESLSSLL
jgi:glycosyltransferase involved in cell wall biosynthesis